MARRTKRATEVRIPLSRERVLRAALGLADSGGIEALTMRQLGEAVGVEAMSLYSHVANKEDLLEGLVDIVCRQVGEGQRDAAGVDHGGSEGRQQPDRE